jgi:hypothetical protein
MFKQEWQNRDNGVGRYGVFRGDGYLFTSLSDLGEIWRSSRQHGLVFRCISRQSQL